MNIVKRLFSKHNSYPTDESNMIPSGQLYLVRSPSSPKSENECLYNDAIITIRDNNHQYDYQMVVWKGNSSDSDSLSDDEDNDTDVSDNFFENDSNILKSFIIDSSLNISLFERYQQKIISWRDMEGDLGDMFEYRITPTVPIDTVEQFMTTIYKCQYERKYRKSSANISVADIKEFIVDRNQANCLNPANSQSVSSTLDMNKLLSQNGQIDDVEYADEGDSDEEEEDEEDDESYNTSSDDDEESEFVDAPETPSQTVTPEQNSARILVDSFPCNVYSYSAEAGSFKSVSEDSTVSLYEISNWNYCFEVQDNNKNTVYALSLINEQLDPTFKFEQFAFLFNIYTQTSATTWLIKFEDRTTYEAFQTAFMKLHWQYKNEAVYKNAKEDEDYLIDSLEAMDIDDSDNDDVEENAADEVEPISQVYSFKGKRQKPIVDSDDSDEESDYEERKFNKASKNSGLAVGLATDRTFISKDDKLGIFKANDSGIEFLTTIDKLSYSKDVKKKIRPGKMMLMDSDRTMIVQGKNDFNSLHKIDIERGKVVEDWQLQKDNHNINIESFTTNQKYGDLSTDPTFLGVSSQSMFRVDPRLGNGFIGTDKEYKTKVGFKEVTTTGSGNIAVASDNGAIRLYDSLGKIAKTSLPALGDKIIGLDTSKDGRYIIATCSSYLLLIDTMIKDGRYVDQLGFTRSFPADSKPKPFRLQLRPENIAYIKQNYGQKIVYSRAKFNECSDGEAPTQIISSIGPFAITWNIKKVLAKKSDCYKIRMYQDNVIMGEFVNNDSNHMVLALSDNVALASTSSFRRPSDEFNVVKTAF